jgi:hypothetical protein
MDVLAVLAVAAIGVATASGTFGDRSNDGEAAAATGPVVGCDDRAEPTVNGFSRKRDVVRGPFALLTVARDLPRLSRASYRPRNGQLATVKLPAGLRAAHRATLRVAPRQRRYAALSYRSATRTAATVQAGDQAVTFIPCTPDTPAFSGGGTVGSTTGWAGNLVVTGPRCLRLQVRVDGRRQPDIALPLGRRCTP